MPTKAGLHWPYDVPNGAPPETWRLLDLARPDLVVIMSHAPATDYERLLRLPWRPHLIIRAKTGPKHLGHYPEHILDYLEWETEHSLRDAIEQCIRHGQVPYVTLGCEPDIELAREPVDEPAHMAEAMAFYIDWWWAQVQEIRTAYPTALLAPAALSQGSQPRFDAWAREMDACWQRADWIAEHCYTDGQPWEHPWWGARWRYFTRQYPGKPLFITETNDNGRVSPDVRPAHIAGYLMHLREKRVPMLAGVVNFILPGGADDQARIDAGQGWWLLTDDDVHAWRQAATVALDPEPETIHGGGAMTDEQVLHDALMDIWRAGTGAAPKDVPFNPDAAIVKHWRDNIATMGAPVGPERASDSGRVYQAFVTGVWVWTGDAVKQAA